MTTTRDLSLSVWKHTSISCITEHADFVNVVCRKLFAEVQFLVFVTNAFFLITSKTRLKITRQNGRVSISRLQAISGYSSDHRTYKSRSNNHMSATMYT